MPVPSARPHALIVGAGIAGTAAALALRAVGWDATIVERAPARRRGGYLVFFRGDGYRAARRLGVADDLRDRLGPDSRWFEIDRRGRTLPGMRLPADARRRSLTLLRSDIEAALHDRLPDDVPIRYGRTPVRVSQAPDHVLTTLDDATEIRSDLLIGADGSHSAVRRLAFGPERAYRYDFGHVVAACMVGRSLPGLATGDTAVMPDAGRAAWVAGFRDCGPVAYFLYRSDDPGAELRQSSAAVLRRVFGDHPGPLMPGLLDAAEAAGAVHFDQVSQIRMPRWTDRRVALLGDAAWSLSLYSAYGACLAVEAAANLADEVAVRDGRPLVRAVAAWERRTRPTARHHADRARRMQHLFLPANRQVARVRRAAIRLSHSPLTRPLALRLLPQPL
ncbi:FAD-dependent monooxygenase [Streptomyces sp. NPDC018045]|uniref:FAD-dependent monooxygenase n=1 Tax=Streptomyces sp. NPDC018045 TaxID=3365037 RepID=UPI00379D7609